MTKKKINKKRQERQGQRLKKMRRRQRQREMKKITKKKDQPKIKPYEQVKMKMFSLPNPFKSVPKEERRKILQDIGKKANEKYEKLYPAIKEWVVKFDPVYILSYCAVYFLSSPEGIDKEAIDGRLDFYHHYLELLQAFALTEKRNPNLEPLASRAIKLQEDMQKIGEVMQFRSFDFPDNISDKEIMKRYVLSSIQGQTTAIRNWAYPEQTINIVKQLFEGISREFTDKYNLNHSDLIDVIVKLTELSEKRLNEHINKVREFYKEKDYKTIYKKYQEMFPDTINRPGDDDKLFKELADNDIEQFRGMLVAHADLRLSDVFTFDINKIAELYGDASKVNELKTIFNHWSYKFGDLNKNNIDYFVLDNPVLHKPFIKITDDEYYSPILGICGHFLLELMEGLIADDSKILTKYNDTTKPKYLEGSVEKLFRDNFPSANIYPNVKWKDSSGQEFETDLLVILDSFALIIEDKSGKIDSPTRRGAELRVIKKLDELIVSAIKQANNFISFLTSKKGIHKFISNKNTIEIDTREINYFVPISVTFENFGNVSSNLKEAIQGGLILNPPDPMAPSMSLADLEVVFTLLENEIQCLHYLVRRSEFEKHKNYTGDELDLLAFYLDTGFNVGEFEFSQEPINISMKSKELDPYFTGIARGVAVDKPKLKITKWWKDIIDMLIVRKPKLWAEMGYILLNVSLEDQKKFEQMLNNLKRRIKKGKVKYPVNWVGLIASEKHRPFNIIGFPYTTRVREEKNQQINQIMSDEKKEINKYLGGICIAMAYKNSEYPYGTIAYLPGNIKVE